MPKATSPLAVLAVLVGALAASSVDAAAREPTQTARARVCEGGVLTIAWGRATFDSQGACRPDRSGRASATAAVTTRSTVSATNAQRCPNRRSYLGGAVVICDDAPRAEIPR